MKPSFRVVITGRLYQNCQVRQTVKGTNYATFTLPLNGKKKEDQTIWVRVTLWDKEDETTHRLVKNTDVQVSGKLYSNTYTKKDGTVVTDLVVEAEDIQILNEPASQSYANQGFSVASGSNESITADEIPF
jgi:single-stranded DNA-binding protein